MRSLAPFQVDPLSTFMPTIGDLGMGGKTTMEARVRKVETELNTEDRVR